MQTYSFEIGNALATCNAVHYPHLRFMQFIEVFQEWVEREKGRIIFYVNDDELPKLIEEFSVSTR